MMAAMFILYIVIRCRLSPISGPALPEKSATCRWPKSCGLLAPAAAAGIFFAMMVPFVNGWTSLVESSAIGALTAFARGVLKGRMTRQVFENSVRNTLGISCMFMWIILAALAFGAVFDGLGAVRAIENLFTDSWASAPG
jgi:TRAP-type mannitol/chloroaromatic compound transport system permease large subunit